MEIKLSIEKKYMWFFGLLIVAVGLVFAYGEGTPDKVGHMQKDINGLDTNGNNIPDNVEKLEGKTAVELLTDVCKKDGTNCPTAQPPAGVIYKRNGDDNCGNTALLCYGFKQGSGFGYYIPQWFDNGAVRYWVASGSGNPCQWVLCAQ